MRPPEAFWPWVLFFSSFASISRHCSDWVLRNPGFCNWPAVHGKVDRECQADESCLEQHQRYLSEQATGISHEFCPCIIDSLSRTFWVMHHFSQTSVLVVKPTEGNGSFCSISASRDSCAEPLSWRCIRDLCSGSLNKLLPNRPSSKDLDMLKGELS